MGNKQLICDEDPTKTIGYSWTGVRLICHYHSLIDTSLNLNNNFGCDSHIHNLQME